MPTTYRMTLGVLLLFSAACRRPAADDAAGGRFTLTRTPPRAGVSELVSAPALGTWCAEDTSLTVVAVTPRGQGGTAVRLHWPLKSMDTFQVNRVLAAVGYATVAWRPMQDTVRLALVADSGQVRIQAGEGATVSGSLTAWARGDSGVVRLDGTLADIPVVTDCGLPQ